MLSYYLQNVQEQNVTIKHTIEKTKTKQKQKNKKSKEQNKNKSQHTCKHCHAVYS